MSKYAIESTTLTAIGDAIREKTGTEDLIPVPQLASKILEISGGSGGGDVSVTNGVLKTGTAEQDLQAGSLATFREYDPSFVSYSDSYPINCNTSLWAGDGINIYENFYYQGYLKYIVPIGQGHFLFNNAMNGESYWNLGYMGDDDKFHVVHNVISGGGITSDKVCSGIIGFTEEGYVVYGCAYPSANTAYQILQLNPEEHTLTRLDGNTNILQYASSNANSKFMFNTKLVKLPSENKYLVVSLAATTSSSSYQYYTFMAFTFDPTTETVTKDGECYYRYTSSGVQHYLGDVEVVSDTEVRIITNKGVMKATASSTTWSSVPCTFYAWPDTTLDQFDLKTLVKYDDERYLASEGTNYLYMFKWSGSAYTIEKKIYLHDIASEEGTSKPLLASADGQIFLQDDKTFIYATTATCSVFSYDTSTKTFTCHNTIRFPLGYNGYVPSEYYSIGGRIDKNTFYMVRGEGSSYGYCFPIMYRVGEDKSISALELWTAQVNDIHGGMYSGIKGYVTYNLSACCNKMSNCYQDGVLLITAPQTSSTTATTTSQNSVVFKIDKDVIKKGAAGWGTPCLVKDNISAGATGQAYVIE